MQRTSRMMACITSGSNYASESSGIGLFQTSKLLVQVVPSKQSAPKQDLGLFIIQKVYQY